nr:MAG TPA: hypothetical protein [Caudoviricetes sp.]
MKTEKRFALTVNMHFKPLIVKLFSNLARG